MGRTTLLVLLLASLGCGDGGEDEGATWEGDSLWTPGGAGEVDPTPGATRQYSNGHSLDWLETDQNIIDSEIELIGLINAHRASRGLRELLYDKALTRCARGHSRHHYEHGLFTGHDNPEGEGFTNRMINNGLDFEIAGENIRYGAFTASVVFDGWLNSPDHRANLERLCFVRIGVGRHQLVWTANFAR